MLLRGGEQEVLKGRIHFIHFLILGGVPDRVPWPHKLLAATQKVPDCRLLSKIVFLTVTDDGRELLVIYHIFLSQKC